MPPPNGLLSESPSVGLLKQENYRRMAQNNPAQYYQQTPIGAAAIEGLLGTWAGQAYEQDIKPAYDAWTPQWSDLYNAPMAIATAVGESIGGDMDKLSASYPLAMAGDENAMQDAAESSLNLGLATMGGGSVVSRMDDIPRAALRSNAIGGGKKASEPMDAASRMARADEMFPVETYHSTTARDEFPEFSKDYIGSATDEGKLGEGFYFSDKEPIIPIPGRRTMETRLAIKDPLRIEMPDFETDKAGIVRSRLGLPKDATPKDVTDRLTWMGYDAVELDYSPTGYASKEYMVPEPNQIRDKRAAFARKDKDSANLFAANRSKAGSAMGVAGLLDDDAPGLLGAGVIKPVKGVLGPVPGVAVGDELIGIHNTTADKLAFSDKLGGMPVPSIGITKTGAPMEGFGDISLIAGDSLTTPSRTNPMFASDAYTPRYPSVSTHFSAKDDTKISEFFASAFGKDRTWETPKDEFGGHFAYGGDFAEEVEKYGFKGLEGNDLAKAKFLHEKGVMPDPAKFMKKQGSYDWRNKVDKIVEKNKPEFKQWLSELPDRIGVTPSEKIWKGYTYSGTPRYAPHTMDNVVKEMKGNLRDGEAFNYGLGSLRSTVTPKFKNKKGIKAKRDLVVSKDDMEAAKEGLNEEFFSIATKLNDMDTGSGYGYDVIQARLSEGGLYGTRRALKEYYPDISDSMIKEVDDFLTKLANSPTEYFEGKPQRAVGIDEFKGALVPNGTPKATVQSLKDKGLKVVKYKDAEDRLKKIRKFSGQMFGVGGAGLVTGGLLSNDGTFGLGDAGLLGD